MARRRPKPGQVMVDGGDEFRATLAGLSDHMKGTYLLHAVRRGAEIPRAVAEGLAPRSEAGSHGRAPGFLAESMMTEDATTTPTRAEVAVGPHPKAFYGLFQEVGTVHQQPQPFLRPAFDETKDSVVDQIKESFDAMLHTLIVPR